MCSTLPFDFHKFQQISPTQIVESIHKFHGNLGKECCTFLVLFLYFSYRTQLEYLTRTYRKTIRHFQSKKRRSMSVKKLMSTSLAIMTFISCIPLDNAVCILCHRKKTVCMTQQQYFRQCYKGL